MVNTVRIKKMKPGAVAMPKARASGRTGAALVMTVLALVLAAPAWADGPGEAALRAQTQAIGRAIETQTQQAYRKPLAPAGLPAAAPALLVAAGGAALHAGPAPDTPVLARLQPGTPVSVTAAVGDGDWLAVIADGRSGYLAADRLSSER
jgi:hypothetical protein